MLAPDAHRLAECCWTSSTAQTRLILGVNPPRRAELAPLCPKRTERFDLPPPSPLSPFPVRAKDHKLAMEILRS